MKKLKLLAAVVGMILALSLCEKASAQVPMQAQGVDPQQLQRMMQLFQNMDPQQMERLRQFNQNMEPEQRQAMREEFMTMDSQQQMDALQQFAKMDPQQMQNMTPEQMLSALHQRASNSLREQLSVTNDADWTRIELKIAAVKKARVALAPYATGMGGGFGGMRAGGSQTSIELQALRDAKDSDTPATQIRDLLAKYRAARKEKQSALAKAQEELRSLLSTRQTAILTLNGLLD